MIFDERMKGYGFEDTDFINRLKKNGIIPEFITDDKYLQSISHAQVLRVKDEEFTNNIKCFFLHHINHYTTGVYVLYQGNKMEFARLVDNRLLSSLKGTGSENFQTPDESYDLSFDSDQWLTGEWKENNSDFFLKYNQHPTELQLKPKEPANMFLYESNEGETFYCVTEGALFTDLVYVYPQIKNRIYMGLNTTPGTLVNKCGYGKGSVNYNLTSELKTIT